uniref:Uncharacterized protein n=1 Tax=Anguilla anguilla TaxID=7936 RepID=A0A0E9T6Y8_ANGAN
MDVISTPSTSLSKPAYLVILPQNLHPGSFKESTYVLLETHILCLQTCVLQLNLL